MITHENEKADNNNFLFLKAEYKIILKNRFKFLENEDMELNVGNIVDAIQTCAMETAVEPKNTEQKTLKPELRILLKQRTEMLQKGTEKTTSNMWKTCKKIERR